MKVKPHERQTETGQSSKRTQTAHTIHKKEYQDYEEEVKGRETIFRNEENFPWRTHFRHNSSKGEGQGDVHVPGSQSFQLIIADKER